MNNLYYENKLFSSLLQNLDNIGRINLDSSFVPPSVKSRGIQRYYNLNSLWFVRLSISKNEVYYYFGLDDNLNVVENSPILILKFNTYSSKSTLKFIKGGSYWHKSAVIVIKIWNNDSQIKDVLEHNFNFNHYSDDLYCINLGWIDSSDVFHNILKLVKSFNFDVNIENNFVVITGVTDKELLKKSSKFLKPEENDHDVSLINLKTNIEIIKIKKLIDDLLFNQKFKKELNEFLFSVDKHGDFKFKFNLLNNEIYIEILLNTIKSFKNLKEDIGLFSQALNSNIQLFFKDKNKPAKPRIVIRHKHNAHINKKIIAPSEKSKKRPIDISRRLNISPINLDTIESHIGRQNEVYFIHRYIPKDLFKQYGEKEVYISKKIWKYKDNYRNEREFFTKELMVAISYLSNNKMPSYIKRICLVAIPSSTIKRDGNATMRESINMMEKWYYDGKSNSEFNCNKEIINGGGLLHRCEDVPTSHLTGIRPSKERHEETINCNRNQIPSLDNMIFIILDDITTRGKIMEACEEKLMKNGVKKSHIIKLAIAGTVER